MKTNTRNILISQTKFELLKLFRMPAYVITLIILPLFFYGVTGANEKLPITTEGYESKLYLICTLGTFATFGIALFGFGVGFSIERSQGWYKTIQVAPIPTYSFIASKIIACCCLTLIGLLMLAIESKVVFDIELSFIQWFGIIVTLLLGVIPLAFIGLTIGSFFGTNAVPIIMIMFFLAISSMSGLLAPVSMLEKGNPELAKMVVIYPTYHIYQLALSNIQSKDFITLLNHILVVVAYTVFFASISLVTFKRQLQKSVG